MTHKDGTTPEPINRRGFFKTAGAGVAAAGLMLTPGEAAQNVTQVFSEKEKLNRLASNSYPLRSLFKSRAGGRGGGGRGGQMSQQMKEKYGEITMLDFPQFTKDTFQGVVHMDIWSSLFGDVTDESMFSQQGRGFDPGSASGKKWLDQMASRLVKTGTHVHHISNNAPTGMAGPEEDARKAGIEVAKKWLDAAATLGAKSMRVNSGGPNILPQSANGPDGYPKNDAIVPYLRTCIESFKEMADYGAERNVKVTLENHWGLTSNPMNIRIIIEGVNHPYCEASPDFGNWEHEYLLFSGLKDVAPYAHTTVHAKYWDRWTTNDVQRSTRIMLASGFTGKFALEYEAGPWDGVEGCKYLYKEVLAALSTPSPVI